MDRETREYLDQKLVSLARKEDMEKVRQEMKATLRHWKEEAHSELTESKKDIMDHLQKFIKEEKMEAEAIRKAWVDGQEILRQEMKSMIDQSAHGMGLALREIREDIRTILHQAKEDLISKLPLPQGKEQQEFAALISSSRRETKADLDRLEDRLNKLQEQVRKVGEDIGLQTEKVQTGLIQVKEELSSMIKFSFADLERRIHALEARIKVLEKIVLQ